jgi:hypothetical protein
MAFKNRKSKLKFPVAAAVAQGLRKQPLKLSFFALHLFFISLQLYVSK